MDQFVHIQGIKIKNFKALKNVTLGRLWNTQDTHQLTPLTVVIGKNGTGKSSLMDAFGFLADCLIHGVESACDINGRGGYEKIHSLGMPGPIEFEIYYKENRNSRPITYEVAIDLDKDHRPYVLHERLRQRRSGQRHGRPFSFLFLDEGEGRVWKGNADGTQEDDVKNILREESNDSEAVSMDDKRKLGIATLGALKAHPRIAAFRKFIEGWYLSYFIPDAARSLPLAGAQRRLNVHGDNLGNVVQFMERDYPKEFHNILISIANKIPGIQKIDTVKTPDGRLLLRFNDKGFKDPFYAQQMSDGTLKVFAYMILLADPTPPPFICIEEPENGLYHKLLEVLVEELRLQTKRGKSSPQIFVTTHQPYLVDALSPEEVWILNKESDGFSTIKRASDIPLIKNLCNEGIPLGGLWYSDYLEEYK
ncbi:AAA family ATPase [Megasphaera stantonii]|uniref:AAA family ATPase n=1 Tax=Megasphaera stantonii TaxID=2144175 RepID=UPI0023F2D1F0|nr:AAA family ATPase [Megasphaera stantonii]